MPEEIVVLGIMSMLSGVAIIGLIAWTFVERAKLKSGTPPKALAAMDARLERIEQAMDAIAVEVERISEGQRFTTKLLADRTAQDRDSATTALLPSAPDRD